MSADDLELLEMAAKAAGMDVHRGKGAQAGMLFRDLPEPKNALVSAIEWNPLTDDGDALRLAVRMRFYVCVFSATDDGLVPMPGFVEVGREEDKDPLSAEYVEGGAGYESTTRRAIVRAAAEVGRDMP